MNDSIDFTLRFDHCEHETFISLREKKVWFGFEWIRKCSSLTSEDGEPRIIIFEPSLFFRHAKSRYMLPCPHHTKFKSAHWNRSLPNNHQPNSGIILECWYFGKRIKNEFNTSNTSIEIQKMEVFKVNQSICIILKMRNER